MGIVQVCPYSLRFCLHDLVRETFAAYVSDYLGGEVQEAVDECKQRMLQHYFDLMEKFNFEHKFSGIAVTPGYEQYDLELENMKAVMNFMQEDEKNHIDCVNRSRYLIADRVFAIKRGVLYQKLIGNVDKCENEYHKADFLEGFAMVYFDLTDYNKAYTQAKRAFEIKENAFVLSEKPTDELELLCVLKLLGDLTSTTRAYDHAKKYFERIISVATKHAQEWQKIKMEKKDAEGEGYDENEYVILDPFLAHAQSNLAVIALYANDFKTGRKLFNRAVTVLKRIYGTVHPEISKAYAGYANILKQFKNVRQFYDEINALFKEAIEIDTKLFSSNSVLVVERMDDYGVSLLGQSKFAEAEKLFRQTLDARKVLLGGNVIDLTLSATMNNLAVALKNQGKYVEAESFYEQSLQMLVELLGDKHYQVSVAKANLAHVYASNNKGDRSEKLYMEAFDALQNSTEPGNDEVMAAMLNNMGDAARLRKEFDKAIEYYQHALAIRKKLSTDLANDPEIAKTLSSIAKLYFDKGENKQALELQEQALSVIEKQVGKNHPQYAAGITNIANMYFKEQKYKEAEQYFTEALNIRRQLKEEDVKLVAVVQSLAVTLEKQKRYRDAEVLFRDVLVITESNQLGEEKMLSVINSIAACLSHQKNFPEAEKYYSKAQQLILKESGEESMQNADVLCNIGAVQLSQDNYDDAENAFAKALTIYESNYGPDHEKVVNLQEHLSEIRQLIYQRDRANKCCIVA